MLEDMPIGATSHFVLEKVDADQLYIGVARWL